MTRPFGTGDIAERIRAFDWSATALGPIATWPVELMSSVETMLAMPRPATLLWGDALLQLYNDAYIDIARDRHPALLGRPVAEGWSDIYDDAVAQRLATVRAGGAVSLTGREVALRDADGRPERRTFDITWSAVRDGDGAIRGALQQLVEVTDHRRATAQLRDSEAQLRMMVTTGSHMLFRMSADWGQLLRLDGRDMLPDIAEPITDWVERFIPDEDRGAVFAAMAAALDGPTMYELEHRVRCPDGAIGWVASRAIPILDAEGRVTEWFGTGIDITARRTAEEIVRRSEEMRRIALDGGGMGAWRIDLATREVRGDARFFALWGMPPSDEPRPASDFLARLSPDGLATVSRFETRRIAPGAEFDGEMEIVAGPTAGCWLRWRGRADGPDTRILHGVVFDVTEQRQATERLRERDEMLRLFGDASTDALSIRDAATLHWRYVTPAFRTIYGRRRRAVLTGDHHRNWLALILPEDRARVEAAIARVRGGAHVTVDYRIRRAPDGAPRWLRTTEFPIRDAGGQVVLIGGITSDVTASRQAREAVARSEERLRSAVEVGGIGLWDWNVATDEVHWSAEHFLLQGYPVGSVEPSYSAWLARVHPDDRAEAETLMAEAMGGGRPYKQEFRVVHPDGSIHWHSARGRFFFDDAGQPVRMVGAIVDVTERRVWTERQQVLIAELQHRTRNLIGVVQALADKCARASRDLPDFHQRFGDRLQALVRAQGLLSRLSEDDRVTFDSLLDAELAALDGEAAAVTLSGPNGVRLRSSTVQTLAMALHELATNAVKYGALGAAGGKLSIAWRLAAGTDGTPWLHIDWHETGVAMPAAGHAPLGSGEGRELIEHALPYQLGAQTSFDLGADGVRCRIAIPISRHGG
ncbi:MAG: PAS domain-containing protein [Sphingomonas phyllosphaerae]|uniref:PAS domain-containing protein n=1 Tax=Sphingomonas phyllosphaerae TaxID=257003 RepID=UPI002FF7A61D